MNLTENVFIAVSQNSGGSLKRWVTIMKPLDKTKRLDPACGGHRVDEHGNKVVVLDESEHFYSCSACGQAVDMRNLGQVFHHEIRGHKPIPLDS